MTHKTQRIAGWILTGLVALFMIGASGAPKVTNMDFPGKEEMFAKLGIPANIVLTLGVLEIIVTLLYIIPRTSFLGAVLMTGYLGGALWTHLRVGEPWWFPIIIGVLMWVGLELRYPIIFWLAFHESSARPVEAGNVKKL
jgi:uncharacterized membrane protein YphA (DoxX/SURF4 family)